MAMACMFFTVNLTKNYVGYWRTDAFTGLQDWLQPERPQKSGRKWRLIEQGVFQHASTRAWHPADDNTVSK